VLRDFLGAEVQEPSRNGTGEPRVLLELVVEPGEAALFESFAALQQLAHLRDEFAQNLLVGPAFLLDAPLHRGEVEVASERVGVVGADGGLVEGARVQLRA